MVDKYGNYVVQRALKQASKEDKIYFVKFIFSGLEKIREQNLVVKWKSIIESALFDTLENEAIDNRPVLRADKRWNSQKEQDIPPININYNIANMNKPINQNTKIQRRDKKTYTTVTFNNRDDTFNY